MRPLFNRWLNPFHDDPELKARLPPLLRLPRALLISARNLGLLVLAFYGLIALANAVPDFVIAVGGLGLMAAIIVRIRRLDARGEDVSQPLALGFFALTIVVLAYIRALADGLGVEPRFAYVIDLDAAVFGGQVPTVWLQESLYSPGAISPLDVFCSIVYFSFFTVPALMGVALWHLDGKRFRLYVTAFVVMQVVAETYFVFVPTAPPWLAAQTDHLPQVTRIVPLVFEKVRPGLYQQGYEAVGPNDFAAFPSLHLGETFLVMLAAWKYGRLARLLGVAYVFSMGFSLVYLGEHYVSDLYAGGVLAAAAWMVALRLTPRTLSTTSAAEHVPRGVP